jgi:hypothetical protein
MRNRWLVLISMVALVVVGCNGDDAELTTESTLITEPTGTQPPTEGSTTTAGDDGDGGASPSTTLAGQPVAEYEVVHEIPNEDGVAQHIVIPNGAYTDVDLQNFVFDLLEANPDLYGIEVFDDSEAAEAFLVPEEERTEEQSELLEESHFVTVTGRARIDYRGPFSEFPGGAIGS